MKISELAKELGVTSKELILKATTIGIEVKTANSSVDEHGAKKIRNAMAGKSTKKEETKIVKVSHVDVVEEDESPKVQVKVAKVSSHSNDQKTNKPGSKMPVGKPVVPKDVANRNMPVGKPMSKDADHAAKKEDVAKDQPVEKEAKKTVTNKKNPDLSKKAPEPAKTPMAKRDTMAPERRGPIIVKKADPEAERIKKEKEQARQERQEKREQYKANHKNDRKDRPERKDRNDKGGPRGNDRPDRPDRNDKGAPRGNDYQNRPPRKPRDENGPKKTGSDSATPAPLVNKETRAKKPKEKDRDKFSKFESGNKYQKSSYGDGNLEKKTRGKKQQKVKEVEVEEIIKEELPVGTKVVNVPITVAGLCEQLGVSTSKVIMTLLKLGIVSNVNQSLDGDTVEILASELNINVVIGKEEEVEVEEGLELFEDKEEQLKPRPPIITVMGHVDHGKTSLLDAIRTTNVTASESGGITQHIGASEVEINGRKIVFLDTPGHEAFTAMRARGANITDIAVLVVAADDSVKPQTIESISHAKAAGVPIIVAINKMDKPGANPDKVKKDLADHGVLVEEWGGDVITVPVSAKTGDGIVNLLEMILLQADVLELKANPDRLAMGTVIEARLDKARGPVATLLVTNGTLKAGQSVVAGTSSGRIRLMTNFKGDQIRKAGPATAVEILGLTEVPAAGDDFNAVKEDRLAKEIAENRKERQKQELHARTSSTTLEELFSQIQAGEVKDLNLIIKGDVRGSVGAVVTSLEKLSNENVRVKIIHSGVGAVTESDVTLAGTSGAIIIGFNVRPSTAVATMADRENVQIKTYRVIYNIIEDIENAMKGMLDPEYKEVILGTVEIRETFKVPGIGIIGGAYVTSGKVVRNAEVRLVRDGIVIHEGKISSLKRFKDDAKEVAHGYECGIGIENYNDLKEGDIIECFQMEEIKRD